MKYIPRSQWGARPPRSHTLLPAAGVMGLAVHYTGMDADEQSDHKNCAGRVAGIQNYHMDHNKWADLAYSWVACKHGYVYEGRGWGIRTAAQGTNTGNDHYHAVCFLGDDTANRDDVTVLGRGALLSVVRESQEKYGDEVRPHSFFHSTGCPGDELRSWIASKPWAVPVPPKPVWSNKVTFTTADGSRKKESVKVAWTWALKHPLAFRRGPVHFDP